MLTPYCDQLCTCIERNDMHGFKQLFSTHNVNDTYGAGWTMLHHLMAEVTHNKVECIRLLIQLGANVNVRTEEGNTPLHIAVYSVARRQSSDIAHIKVLLESRADVNLKAQKKPVTPLEALCCVHKTPQTEVAWLLLEYGALLPSNAPNPIFKMHAARQKARRASLVFVGIRRFRISKVMNINGMDVAKLIGKFVWQQRRNWPDN